jgi:hypothetical protein
MPEYRQAPWAASIAYGVIEKHHRHLEEANIACVFRSGTWSDGGGGTILASAGKVGAKMQAICGDFKPDFIITINEDAWMAMDEKSREALIDHELCHCIKNGCDSLGNPKWGLVGHDVEEFEAIIRRHGLWKSDLKRFGRAVNEQMSMFAEELPSDYRPMEESTAETNGATVLPLVK